MAISCTDTLVRAFLRRLKRYLTLVMATVVFMGTSAGAAVTPRPVLAGGLGPLTFDTQPGYADGFSTAQYPLPTGGSHFDITNIVQMDRAIATNSTAVITNDLGISPTINPPSANAIFRWNSVKHYLQSRPTGDAYTALLLTMENASGVGRDTFIVYYDFTAEFLSNSVSFTTEG